MMDEDLTLVTNNWIDFRPMLERLEVHPGVVVILPTVRRERQMELFPRAHRDPGTRSAAGHDQHGRSGRCGRHSRDVSAPAAVAPHEPEPAGLPPLLPVQARELQDQSAPAG
jgi:hypothetical protein